MQFEFDLNSKLKSMERDNSNMIESQREDRKDARIDRQAEHQHSMIDKRKEAESFKKFESSGNDIVTGGANTERFGI